MTDAAPPAPPPPLPEGTRVWGVTDGKAGDVAQVEGLLDRLARPYEMRVVAPRTPWVHLLPFGPIDPREAPGRPGGPLEGPLPDLAVATGRRAVKYLAALKRATGGRCFTVCLKRPATGVGAADLIWVPAHDRFAGPNVLVTLTSPHRLSPQRLAAARAAPDPRLAALPRPLVAVAIGGPNKDYRFDADDQRRLLDGLDRLVASGASLAVTASRRTPPALAEAVAARFAAPRHFVWDGTGENPYTAMLALADAVVVTQDSTNMMSEAPATGAPMLLFTPSGRAPKMERLAAALVAEGLARPLDAGLVTTRHAAVDATDVVATAVLRAFADRSR